MAHFTHFLLFPSSSFFYMFSLLPLRETSRFLASQFTFSRLVFFSLHGSKFEPSSRKTQLFSLISFSLLASLSAEWISLSRASSEDPLTRRAWPRPSSAVGGANCSSPGPDEATRAREQPEKPTPAVWLPRLIQLLRVAGDATAGEWRPEGRCPLSPVRPNFQ